MEEIELPEFNIPTGDELARYTPSAINDLRNQALSHTQTVLGKLNETNVKQEHIDYLQGLKDFSNAAKAELDGRTARASALAALSATEEPAAEVEPVVAEGTPLEPVSVTASSTAVETIVVTSDTAPIEVNFAEISGGTRAGQISKVLGDPVYATIVAAADVPGFPTGTTLD